MLSKRLTYSEEYEKLATEVLKNIGELETKNEYRKAGEMLWGAIVNYGKAILSLLTENPDEVRAMGHREFTGHIKKLLLHLNVDLRLMSDMEKLHANFYEGFVSKEEYLIYKREAFELISIFSKKLRELRSSL